VSGNVSLYNETNGTGIHPTPAIGGVGLLQDSSIMVTIAPQAEGEILILIGDTKGHLGASLYLEVMEGREEGTPPPVDLALEKKNGDFIRAQIEAGNIAACHDISDGGLYVALAEMAMAANMGMTVAIDGDGPLHNMAFGEDQARYILSVPKNGADTVLEMAQKAGVMAQTVGNIGGDTLTLTGTAPISVAELLDVHQGWMPDYMSID
jgi:phosphoribosylformylglycinamidine synthase